MRETYRVDTCTNVCAYKSKDAPLLRAQLVSRSDRSVRACRGSPGFPEKLDADFPNVQSVPNAYASVGLGCRWNAGRARCDTCRDIRTALRFPGLSRSELVDRNCRVHEKTALSWISYSRACSPTTTYLMNSRTSERHRRILLVNLFIMKTLKNVYLATKIIRRETCSFK